MTCIDMRLHQKRLIPVSYSIQLIILQKLSPHSVNFRLKEILHLRYKFLLTIDLKQDRNLNFSRHDCYQLHVLTIFHFILGHHQSN